MTLLERAGQFYTALLFEKKFSDPAVVQFRAFMTNVFQQHGLNLANQIDRDRRDGVLADPRLVAKKPGKVSSPAYAKGFDPNDQRKGANKTPMRRFQHPAQGMGKPTGPYRKGKQSIRRALQDQYEPEAESGEPQDQSLAALIKPKSARTAATPAASITPAKGVAAAAEDKPGKPKPLTRAELDRIVEMQPSNIIRDFEHARIVAYLEKNKVRFKADGSPRQVAATLKNHLTRKEE